MNTNELTPPHDSEIERALLGSLLLDADAMLYVADVLRPDMFYRPQHGEIYGVLADLHRRNEPFDELVIANAVKGDTMQVLLYLGELLNLGQYGMAESYAAIVAEKASRRRLLAMAGSVARAAWDESTPLVDTMATAENELIAIRAGNAANPVQYPQQYVGAYVDEFMYRAETEQAPGGVLTGLADLDRILVSLEAPHQYMLAGRPGMGKSSLALSIIHHALSKQGKRVMLFSLEMSVKQVTARLVAMMTGISAARQKRPWELTNDERARVLAAAGQVSEWPLYIDESGSLKPSDLHARAKRAHMERGIDLIVIDYIGLMKPEREVKRVEDLGEISRQLIATGKELNVPMLVLAQLSRAVEQRANKRPITADLRDSGELEQNAYAVIFIYREHVYDDTAPAHEAEAIVAKHRDGETGTANLYWRGELTQFQNAATIDLNPNGRVKETTR